MTSEEKIENFKKEIAPINLRFNISEDEGYWQYLLTESLLRAMNGTVGTTWMTKSVASISDLI